MLGQSKNSHAPEDDVKALLATLRSDFDELRGDVKKLKKRSLSLSKARGKSAARKVRDGMDHLTKSTMKFAGDNIHEAIQDFRGVVRDNPLVSISVALALGLVIEKILFRDE